MAKTSTGPRRSAKGAREASRILDAATAVLARDGMDAASLGRIATEAGVDKKMLVYYFASREALLAQVVSRVGDQLATTTAMSVAELSDPVALANAGIDELWAGTIASPELLRAYFALATSSKSGPVHEALLALKAEFLTLFDTLADRMEAAGHRLEGSRGAYLKMVLAMWRGTALEWIETGDSAEIDEVIRAFKHHAAQPFVR